jgi:electron-transferring-flavoprotein dehydrogenase
MAAAEDRESLPTDVVIVGAGPSGLAAAIRLKQRNPGIAVTVIEKAAEVGGHIISGAVMNPIGLDALLPGWREQGAPVGPVVTADNFHFLTRNKDYLLPHKLLPPQMKTPGAVIISLGDMCKWLAEHAEALGVEIYPSTAAVDVLTRPDGAIAGVITGDLGLDHNGKPKPGFARGIALEAKYTLIAEGARGSLAKQVIRSFGLDAGKSPQKYGLGMKEVWEIAEGQHQPGRIDHYLGFPLGVSASGGGFAYHAANRKLYLGLVVHLDYQNPTLAPFEEFQRFKQHPSIAPLLEGAKRLSYGARTMTSGGWQSIPDLVFPGGALIGCAAGFMNVPALKGIHNAIRSGMGAADAVADAIADNRAQDRLPDLPNKVFATGIEAELLPVRNAKPLWSRLGLAGIAFAGLDMWTNALFKFSVFGTLRHLKPDFAALKPIAGARRETYARPDSKTTFDRSSSVFLANLAHDEDQPMHLRLADPAIPVAQNLPRFGEPAPLYCPAGVYEMAEAGGRPVFRIHAANCVHCKTCDIKDPAQNITWVPPEGGSGPNYSSM